MTIKELPKELKKDFIDLYKALGYVKGDFYSITCPTTIEHVLQDATRAVKSYYKVLSKLERIIADAD